MFDERILRPYQNAIAERINGILKDEFSIDCKINQQLMRRKQSIEIYNGYRPL